MMSQKKQLLKEAVAKGATIDLGIWTSLQVDEQLLILFLQSPTPPPPSTPGNIEFGWALYYLNQEASWLKSLGMPPSKITTAMWNEWWTTFSGAGKVMGDGSWLDTARYAVLDIDNGDDAGWGEAILSYLLVEIGIINVVPFATNPATISIDPNTYSSLTIALMGDWGTGSYQDGNLSASPSQLIKQQIEDLSPDIVIHLGDVYYSGASFEEGSNLLDCWPKGSLGNFTLNSNHEMYDGGNGYYRTALQSNIFGQQQGCSYFAINYGDWVILGLDSAYNATDFYDDGAITDSYQPAFASAAAQGKNTIVLTHHNPMDIMGETLNSLWNDVVGSCLNNAAPNVWYWGHVHNGVVYGSSAPTGQTLSRCLGNGGIPIGNGTWLSGAPNVEYYTHTALGDSAPNNALRVKNGFALLTISNGTVTEAFYDQDGNVAWSG